jgi:hypothetical protein
MRIFSNVALISGINTNMTLSLICGFYSVVWNLLQDEIGLQSLWSPQSGQLLSLYLTLVTETIFKDS